MARIATYVFIDLETTGLPKFEYNKTRITELSMVVVSRRHVLDTTPGAAPRVLDKLTMCFNPGRMIHPESTKTSGLCNDLLEHQTYFNIHVFNIINGFLQCHEKPVCLVAQNGHSFDFPILKNHFDKLGVSLSDDILCADTLHAFYDICKGKQPVNNVSNTNVTVVNNISHDLKSGASSSVNKKIKQTSVKSEDESITISTECISNGNEIQLEKSIIDSFLEDEVDELSAQAKMQQQNEETPHQKPKTAEQSNRYTRCKRKLYWGNDEKPTVPFKLQNVYERNLGRPAIEAHRAENDCIMTMEIAVAKAKQFVEWVDMEEHHCKFNDVVPMTVGVSLQ
uniref:Exonuclease domain-containing protein n=1 Tax=Heliothis virescens TaxID=7102 RepID=A0A2A4K8M0_HELVI